VFTQPLTEMSTRKCCWGVKCGWRVRLTISPPSASRLSRNYVIFNIVQSYSPPQPLMGQIYFILIHHHHIPIDLIKYGSNNIIFASNTNINMFKFYFECLLVKEVKNSFYHLCLGNKYTALMYIYPLLFWACLVYVFGKYVDSTE
jgi:hypothetical protein